MSRTGNSTRDELDRATSDYLALSRSVHTYESAQYDQAEGEAWDRLVAAIEACSADEPILEDAACTA